MPASSLIRILIVDDHPTVREGLCEMISAEPDMTVVGTASDGIAAVGLFSHLQPDITVMDIRLPGLGGFEAIRIIRNQTLEGKFIVMTSFHEQQGIAQAISVGASAYVLKELFGEELLGIIRAVHAGQTWFPTTIHY